MGRNFKTLLALLIAGTALTACPARKDDVVLGGYEETPAAIYQGPPPSGAAGDFLASHYAQSRYDWENANLYLEKVLKEAPDNIELQKRSMILAVGSGDIARAADRAKILVAVEPDNGLALLVLSVNALSGKNSAEAEKYLSAMSDGDLTAFIKPLILGWIWAERGKFDPSIFNDTSIHLYHAAAMSLMLGKKDQAVEYTRLIAASGGLGAYEAERTADLLAALGHRDDALTVYLGVEAQGGTSPTLEKKVAYLQSKDPGLDALLQPLQIKTASEGAAIAMYDMAFVLFQEYSDTSAKIFSQLALSLNPRLVDARFLLGDTLARNERYAEAIAYYRATPKDYSAYVQAQRRAADLLAQSGQYDKARALLMEIYRDEKDVDALIRVGDLFRQEENFKKALESYNDAAAEIGDPVPEKYWYLLYARGMAYERIGDWKKAEADLTAALKFRPENPYLMNYLGYGWADQGLHLDKALDLIQQAVALRPTDGYIADSLGWVLYMMGRYDQAVPQLERAVGLLPYDATINDHLGDAYWRVGRKTEARYQWERALTTAQESDDPGLKTAVAAKLKAGLSAGKPRAALAARDPDRDQ